MAHRGYQHFVPKADKNHKFPNEYNFILIDTIEDLKEVLEKAGDYIAWDLETTGLSPREDKIVGVALSWDDETGYYIPVRHRADNIEDPKLALDLIYEALKEAKKTFVYNMRFDYRFMEFANFGEYDIDSHIKDNLLGFMHHHGYDMSVVNWFDVAIPVWLADTNKKMPSLKWAARHFLGWDMQTFEETLGDNINFQYVEPELAVDYAGADALSTFVLAGATLKFYKESKMAGKIDNKVLYPMMKWEDHPLPIDYKYLERILLDAQETKKELEREIHSMIGYSFNINSGQQLSEGLERLGLHTGEYTKAGYMRTAKDLIAKLDHPISDKLIEYSELSKMISSYISNMSEYAKKEDGKLRFAYKNTRVPTGRLACGGDKKNEYFAKLNLQSIPKASSEMWYVHEADEKHSDEDEDIIMGYRFSREEKSDVVVEGFDPYLNVRKAFLPENDDFYWVSIDFSSQELRIPANLSKEPVWLEAFNSEEGDPHKATAIKLFGEENYDRDKRKKAKGMNFGLLYGMSKYSVKDRFDMDSIQEAEDFVNQYKNTLNTLFAWEERMKKNARKNGTVYTYFGRPRRLKWYFNHEKSGMRAFAYRSSINSPIQGAGSDILKIALIKLWDNVFTNPDYMEDVLFMSTVHDEINFSVRKSKMEEVVPVIKKYMEISVPGWQIDMEADVEFGTSWGQMFGFKWDDDKEGYVPDVESAEDHDM